MILITVSLSSGSTPGQRGVSVGTLVVLKTSVCEGEDTGGASGGGASVGNSLLQTETSQPHSVMAGGSCTEHLSLYSVQGREDTLRYLPTAQAQQHTHRNRESLHLRQTGEPEIN